MLVLQLLLGFFQGAWAAPCATFSGIYAAPSNLSFTFYASPNTPGQCWKFTNVSSYQFLTFTIPSIYDTEDYLYFWDSEYYYNLDNTVNQFNFQHTSYNANYLTNGTVPPPFISTSGVLIVWWHSQSYVSGSYSWSLQVNSIPATGAACATDPSGFSAPTYYGYVTLDKGNCNPAGGTPSGSNCTLGCSAPKSLYQAGAPSQQYYDTTLYCNNGNWLTIYNPAFCYYTAECLGSSLAAFYDANVYNYTSCQSQSFKPGDTCTVNCQNNYIANPSYLPVYATCIIETWGSPYLYHSGWQWGDQSSSCNAPCLSLPTELANPVSYPNFQAGSCSAGPSIHDGSTCTMACSSGYTQLGSLLITCSDGSWQYNPPYGCEAPCTNGPVVNPTAYNSPAPCTTPATSGSSCVLTCTSNYVPSGDLSVTCVNNVWNSPAGSCLAPCTVAPLNPVNGSYDASCSSGTMKSGTTCALHCNAPTVPSVPMTTCTNGVWDANSITCDEYTWSNYTWSLCSAPGANCVAGVPTSNSGTQTHEVDCLKKYAQTWAPDAFCSQAGPKPPSSQACSVPCPQAPTITDVTPYNGAVSISFTVMDPSSSVSNPYVYISYCVATKIGGQCDFNSQTPLVNSLYRAIPFGAQYGYYNATNGRPITVIFYNLTNGVSYSFRIVYQYYNGRWVQSQYSTGSPGQSPSDKLTCYGGCVNGACVKGQCSCDPGIVYPAFSNCSVAATLSNVRFPFTPYNVTQSACPLGYYSGAPGIPTCYGPIQVTWDTNLPMVHVYILPESCRGDNSCLPYYGEAVRFLAGYTVSITLQSGPGTYFARVFWSSQLVAESAPFQVFDPLCAGINCQNGGKCSGGKCTCTAGWKNATCIVPVDPCEKKGLDCGIWGVCNNGNCQCVQNWAGDECQYPPKCGIRCNHGSPNNPLLTLVPGNTWGCTYCICDENWLGSSCDQCSVKCLNGGHADGDCTECECPTWWTGDECQNKYWISNFVVNLKPNNLDLSSPTDQDTFNFAILQDVVGALQLPTLTTQIQVYSIDNRITLWFVMGIESEFYRDNLARQIEGQYWGTSDQDLLFQSTAIGENVDPTTYQEHDPPAAAGMIAPSLLITLGLILLGLTTKF